jgi:cell division septal protein FtsQ
LLLLTVASLGVAWGVRQGWIPLEKKALDAAVALETVSVEGNRRVSAPDLVAASGLEAGMPLLDVDVEAVTALIEAHPWVESARVFRILPSLILVRVEERAPIAVAAEEGGTPWLVDASGLPFAPAEPDDVASLPWLVAPAPVRARVVSMELARGAALAAALRTTRLAEGAEIRIAPPPDPEGLSLLVAGFRGRVVLGHGDLEQKLQRLETLRASGLPETTAAEVIDLRFEDQAVLRSDAPPEPAQHTMVTPGRAPPPPDRRI